MRLEVKETSEEVVQKIKINKKDKKPWDMSKGKKLKIELVVFIDKEELEATYFQGLQESGKK